MVRQIRCQAFLKLSSGKPKMTWLKKWVVCTLRIYFKLDKTVFKTEFCDSNLLIIDLD